MTGSMSEPKKEVAKAAHDALVAACEVIGNRDIEHMTPKIVRSIVVPGDVPEIMHSFGWCDLRAVCDRPCPCHGGPLVAPWPSFQLDRHSSPVCCHHRQHV